MERVIVVVVCLVALGSSGCGASSSAAGRPSARDEGLARVAAIHGAAGPFAVAGWRMGERAMRDLRLSRGSFALDVVHRSPASVQYSCIADGLQAATGASVGRMSLRWARVESPDDTESVVVNRGTRRSVRMRLRPSFLARFLDTPRGRAVAAGREVADMPDDAIFEIVTTE